MALKLENDMDEKLPYKPVNCLAMLFYLYYSPYVTDNEVLLAQFISKCEGIIEE